MDSQQPLTIASLQSVLDAFGATLMDKMRSELRSELRSEMDKLRSEMDKLRTDMEDRMNSMQQQILEIAESLEAVKGSDAIPAADVWAAIQDMNSIRARLTTHLSEVGRWTAPDVGTACYLFFFMVEVAWTLLFHAAGGQKPEPLSKVAVTPCSFKVPVRATSKKNFDLPPPLKGLAADARSKLVDLLTQWSPHSGSQPGTIAYNQMGYWLHALRLLRDVGTHRSMDLIRRQDPIAGTGMAVKVPMSPAAAAANTRYSHMQLPAFGRDPLAFQAAVCNVGFCWVSVQELASAMEVVATTVHDGLVKVLEACVPVPV